MHVDSFFLSVFLNILDLSRDVECSSGNNPYDL